jgi:nitrogenase molybdenum-iron protein alpha chain
VCDKLRVILAADVVPLHCPGFKTRVVASAYDTVYHGLAKYLDLTPRPYIDFTPIERFDPNYDLEIKKYDFIKSRTVNLINASSIGAPDEVELVRLLKSLNLTVRVFTEYSSIDDFRLLTEASLNISMCNVHDDYLLEYLEEKYGVPYMISTMPIGFANTRQWLMSVAERTGDADKANKIIEYEEKEVRAALAPILGRIQGKRVLLNGGVIRVACMAFLMKELGLSVIGVRPYHYDNLSDPIYKRLAEEFPDMDVNVSSNQVFELVIIVKREKPDVVFAHGGSNVWVTKAGAVSIPLFSPNQNYFAYAGIYELARRIDRSTKNRAMPERISENVPLPFRADWYGKSPYEYIEQK